MAVSQPPVRINAAPTRAPKAISDWRESRIWLALSEVAEAFELTWRCLVLFVRSPIAPLIETLRQSATIIRSTAIPLALCASFFNFGALAVLTLTVLERVGAVDRFGFVEAIAGIREFNGWFGGMCVAGIAGTAVVADLGSRKVREELDALLSLGVDPRRALVLPRMIAITVTTPALYLFGTIVSIATGALAGQLFAGYPLATFIHSFSTYDYVDLLAALVKMTMIGFSIAVICCYKGMTTKGGPAGVGRAVNQAVVLAFTATWVLDLLVNTFFLAGFPAAQNIR
jgi:phospholipid/cholesterol/gamma-HCH transport system permease protein